MPSETTFLAIEDFLSDSEFLGLSESTNDENFTLISKTKYWNRLYSPNHLDALYGESSVFDKTSDALKHVITNRILDIASEFLSLGEKTECVFRIIGYPRNTGLRWHNDAGNCVGAFTLYIHPHWSEEWGGELLIADDSKMKEFKSLASGRYVMPKPNRLVIIKPGTQHCIRPVSDSAGDAIRFSLNGFITSGV